MKLLSLFLCCSIASAADFDAALSLAQRTENKVFRDRVKPNWLPYGKTFWYRVQTGPGTHEFVLINATSGGRKAAPSLKALGLPEKEAVKTSAMKVELRTTTRTVESSGLKFINQLSEDVELYWINQEGEHQRYGGVRAGLEREQHTFEGHVWLITSRTGEHLAVGELDTNVDPASTMQVVAALQKVGKTFDFMPIASTGHGAAETPYGSKLITDFLVRYLKP